MSLFPTFSKIFEKLIFDSIYEFIDKNNFFNNNQSGFRPNNSCMHQLIAITHKIFSALDANPSLEVCGIFLDLSKAFDRAWYDGLLYKPDRNGTDGNLFKLIEPFFKQQMSTSCFQWSIFSLEIGYSWCATRLSSRSIIFSHFYWLSSSRSYYWR